jgi:hypothetical protein
MHMFRGIPMNARDSAQGRLKNTLPTADGGQISVEAKGYMDLHNNNGDAWLPDGHAGKFTQVDLIAQYSRNFEQTRTGVVLGILSYILPTGGEITPAPGRGETREVFGTLTQDVLGLVDANVTLFYDIDEVEDFYANGGLSRFFPVTEKFGADAAVTLGYSGEDHSTWTYGVPTTTSSAAGFADLAAAVTAWYDHDENVSIFARVAYSTLVDDEIADWVEIGEGIDPDNTWFEAGILLSY